MYKVVAQNNGDFVVQDDELWTFDGISSSEAKLLIHFGVSIGGLSLDESDNLVVSEDYFLPMGEDEDDRDEDDDYDYDDYDDYSSDDSDEDYSADEEDYTDEEDEDDYSYEDEEEDSYEDYEDYEDYDDYDDYEEEESSVAKLYKFLNEEQIKLLKRYYLWYSQRIFENNRIGNRQLSVKNSPRLQQKMKQLGIMRNAGGLWLYAGFIDMGYKGEGYCTFGHPLRYMHLAWDVSKSDMDTVFFGEDYNDSLDDIINSDDCIVFGIKCVSDFFEADENCVRDLQRAQRESLRDMGSMLDFYQQGMVDEVNESFTFMDYVMSEIKGKDAKGKLLVKDYKPIVNPVLTQFYTQFRRLGLIPPKSLIQEIRNMIAGWSDSKYVGGVKPSNTPVLVENLKRSFGKPFERALQGIEQCKGYPFRFRDHDFKTFLQVLFQFDMCGVYKYNAETSKDEGGASRQAKSELYSMYKYQRKDYAPTKEHFQSTLQFYADLGTIGEYCEKYKWGRFDEDKNVVLIDFPFTLHSYGSVGRLKSYWNQFRAEIPSLVDELQDLFKKLDRLCYNYNGNSIESDSEQLSEVKSKLEANLSAWESFRYDVLEADWQESERKKREAEELLRKAEEERKRVEEEAEKSKNDDLSADEVIKFLQAHPDEVNQVKGLDFHKKVFETCAKSGKTSSKQLYYIAEIYKAITGKGVSSADKAKASEPLSAEMEQGLTWCKDHKSLFEDERTFDIICSILKYRKVSERQMKYALEGMRIYKENNI